MSAIGLNQPVFFIFTFLLTLLISPACAEIGGYSETPLKAKVHLSTSGPYHIGAGDMLSINVYPQTEYSSPEILVRSDGMATFPMLGNIDVSDKTMETLQQELNKLLNGKIKHYELTLNILSPRPAVFYLSGAVNQTGPIEIQTDSHARNYMQSGNVSGHRTVQMLSNVIANAGGVKLNADLSHISVKEGSSGEIHQYDLWKVLKEGDASQNPWLSPGDSVMIPALQSGEMDDAQFITLATSVLSPKNFPVRVLGEVRSPSLVKIEGESPLLSSALAQAGGFAPQANSHVVALRRFTDNNHFSTLYINVRKSDFVLRPNDIVYIGEAKLYKTGRFMQQAALVLQPFQSAMSISGNAAQTFAFGGWKRNPQVNP
jgi:polysaccharide export outer membrane protein